MENKSADLTKSAKQTCIKRIKGMKKTVFSKCRKSEKKQTIVGWGPPPPFRSCLTLCRAEDEMEEKKKKRKQ